MQLSHLANTSYLSLDFAFALRQYLLIALGHQTDLLQARDVAFVIR